MELLNLEDIKNNLSELQNNFWESKIGTIAENALDEGLKTLLPDMIEDFVIEIKNSFIENGFKEGINEIFNSIKNKGEAIKGLFTGDFKDISQINELIKENGIIEKTSKFIDDIVGKMEVVEILDSKTADIIKNGKNEIISNITSKFEKMYKEQSKNIENIEKYSEKWKEAYSNKNFNSMEKNFDKIKELIDKTIPNEKIIEDYKEIESTQTIIKNSDGKFDLSEEEKELLKIIN